MRRTLVAIGAALLLAAGVSMTAAAEDRPTIRMTGEGKVFAAPDIATVTVGVDTASRTAGAALSRNAEAMADVLAALDGHDIAPRDRQTRQFLVQPVYSQPRQGEARTLEGYRVINELAVRVRDLDRMGALLDALVDGGSNRIGAISFDIEDPADLRDQARALAVADARRAANVYAEAAGLDLGPILSITEGGGGIGPAIAESHMRMADAGVAVERGEQAVTATVTIVWAIGAAE